MTRTINHRLPVLGSAFRPPRTRGECIDGTPCTGSRDERQSGQRQCGAYECRHNLLVKRSEEVDGRRHGGLAPEWTMRGSVAPTAPSCVLDVADSGPKSPREIARALGVSTRIVELWLREALRSSGAVRLVGLLSENAEQV